MANIHLFLQGKGGVGKSFCCSMLAQFLIDARDIHPLCFDTDPVNATFAAYPAFNVSRIELMEGDAINPRKFDAMMEQLCGLGKDESAIIDNGASSFIPFSRYLLAGGIPAMLKEMGHNLLINTVITGGDAIEDTMLGFATLAEKFPDSSRLIVWLNPYFGQVVYQGKTFEQFPLYEEHCSKIDAIVRLPELQVETFGFDLSTMLKDRKTFQEAVSGSEYTLMARQRLKITRDKIYGQLSTIPTL